jgi:subtilisin family serine protease
LLTKKLGLFLFISLLSTLLFQNCGDFSANNPSRSSQGNSICKAQAQRPSPFSIHKVHIESPSTNAIFQKSGQSFYDLGLVVDKICLGAHQPLTHFMGVEINQEQLERLPSKGAVAIRFENLPPITEIEESIQAHPCLIGIADNIDIQKTQSSSSVTVNDPQSSQQEHLSFMGLEDSLLLQSQIQNDVVVAVVDTGIDFNHNDLRNQMWRGPQGQVGANMINGSVSPMDDDGHGTHVAGIVAAEQNNSFGVAGLAGSYVKLMAVKSLDANGAGTSLDVYNGIQYAIQNQADIINLSVEAAGRNVLLEDGLNEAVNAGIVVIAATGNQSAEIVETNLFAPAYIGPSLEGVMSVASIDTTDARLSFFSNYSRTYAELSAPGAERSPGFDRGILSTSPNNRFTRIMGTSQAAPMVTAAAAILIGSLKTRGVAYTPAGIESFIRSDGSAMSPALEPYVSGGRVTHIGFLSRNITQFFNSQNGNPNFNGDGTGNQCLIR